MVDFSRCKRCRKRFTKDELEAFNNTGEQLCDKCFLLWDAETDGGVIDAEENVKIHRF